MVELVAFIFLLAIVPAYVALIRYRSQRRPTEQRLRDLEPLIAPWLNRTGAASR